jgi:isoamylase
VARVWKQRPPRHGSGPFCNETEPGPRLPLGATLTATGVNFSVYSKYATGVELLLFDHGEAAEPSQVLPLDPRRHRTYHYWHAHVEGLGPGQIYGYRVHGPWQPERGLRFDGTNLLLDPYAPAVLVPGSYCRSRGRCSATGLAGSMKSVVANLDAFDWQGDRPLQRPRRESVIYELHVRGFTRHPSSGVAAERAGTYLGLIEKIPYLKDLGVTAVELLPVQQFDPQDAPSGHRNYWGYAPVSLLAVHSGYGCSGDPLEALDEFRDDGEGPAPRRHRGDPGCGVQPHRRRRRAGSQLLLPGPGQRGLLPPPTRRQPTPTTAAAATPSMPTTRWCGG